MLKIKQGNLFDQSSNNENSEGIQAQQNTDQLKSTNSNKKIIDTGLGEIIFLENGLTKKAANRLLEFLTENDQNLPTSFRWKSDEKNSKLASDINFTTTAWRQDHIKLYGKVIPLPRLTSWYGDPGMNYTYSGIPCEPNPWNKGLAWLKEKS